MDSYSEWHLKVRLCVCVADRVIEQYFAISPSIRWQKVSSYMHALLPSITPSTSWIQASIVRCCRFEGFRWGQHGDLLLLVYGGYAMRKDNHGCGCVYIPVSNECLEYLLDKMRKSIPFN